METKKKIWLHPPRVGPLEKLEAFPFPEVRFPLKVGNQWTNHIRVVSGFDEYNGETIYSNYNVTEQINDSTWQITAEAELEDEKIGHFATFIFEEGKGFTSFKYAIHGEPFVSLVQIN